MTSIAPDLAALFAPYHPLGTLPSFLKELAKGRVHMVEKDMDEGGWFSSRNLMLGLNNGDDNDDNDDIDGDDDETGGQPVKPSMDVGVKEKTYNISPAYAHIMRDQLALMSQAWSELQPAFHTQSLTLDQENILGCIVQFVLGAEFGADPVLAKRLSKEFKKYQETKSLLPKDVLAQIDNPLVSFKNEYIDGVIKSEWKLFAKTYPPSLGSFLSSTLDLNQRIYSDFAQALPPSHLERNLAWFLESFEATPAQKKALEHAIRMNVGIEYGLPNLVSMFESLGSFKMDAFSDTLDQAFGLPAKTFISLFKDETGLLHKRGIVRHKDGYREEKPYSTAFKRNVLRDFTFSFVSRLEFLRSLSTEYLSNVDPTNSFVKSDFSHIGQDVDNLVTAMTQDQPMRVLITGKPGSGKTSLVRFALSKSNKQGVTVDDNLEDYVIHGLRNFAPILGSPVLVFEGVELMDQNEANKVIKAASNEIEIWTTNDASTISGTVMSSFDMVVDIPTFPFEKRKALAQQLFQDEKLADKIAKICSAPGEIVKLHRWSEISGQRTWKELSVVANNILQASIKAKTDSLGKHLPVTLHQPSDTTYGFEQVVGCNHIVKQAQKVIAGYHHPETFKRLGAKPPKGILLTGGPGFGKTYLVKAMAHEAGVPLLIASSSALSKDPAMIGAVFGEARRQAPCILFLDELDALGASGKKADGTSADPERQAILNRLLTEIDGFEGLTDVMVIGATHRSDVLDEALTRSGRLGWNIHFKRPDMKSRQELWAHYIKGIPTDDIRWERVARLSVGMTPADIHEAVTIASLNAAFDGQHTIRQIDLEKAIDQIEWGLTDENKELVEKELWRTAVHEAGHAVVSHVLNKPIERVTIRPNHMALGFVQPMHDEEKVHNTQDDLKDQILMLFAGTLAEQVILQSRSMGASSDLGKVRETIQTMYRDEGMGPLPEGLDFLQASQHAKQHIEKEEQKFAQDCRDEALGLVEQHREVIERLAKVLIQERELNSDEVAAFFHEPSATKKPKMR